MTGTVALRLALEDYEYKSVGISGLAVLGMRWKNTEYGESVKRRSANSGGAKAKAAESK